MIETSVSRIEVQGRGDNNSGEEGGKTAPLPTSEEMETMMMAVVIGGPKREVRGGGSGEGDEREDGGTEGRGEDGTTGGAPVMMTG